MIRKMKVNEQEMRKIMEIWKVSTIEAHNFICKEYWLKSYKAVKEEYIPDAETYVYLEKNEIKGFISILDGQYIGALFVDINCQGKGVGKKLIEYTKGLYEHLRLDVYKKNEQAVNFYKKVGFIEEYEKVNEETNEVEYTMVFPRC
ncbi:MAG: N-acetyltransferase [Clostridiaceae bacterium]|nr:N-acetyltransferase [Clostridiaceae bacterium]